MMAMIGVIQVGEAVNMNEINEASKAFSILRKSLDKLSN